MQIAQLYRQGLELIEQSSEELVRNIRAVYQRGESFAGTLMQCRQRIVEQRLALDLELAAAVAVRLKTDFPADYGRFVEATGINLNEFLAAGEPDGHVKQARRLVDLLLEYKPLTEQQWKRQTPEDRRQWEAAEQVRVKLDQLQAQAAPFSADWIAFLMEVAPQIQARPERYERVAPYVKPETPVTKDLSPDEARETTERDWLFQADGNPTGERILQEIAWTRQLAARIEANSHGAVRFAGPLAELEGLEKQAAALTAPAAELYFQVRAYQTRDHVRQSGGGFPEDPAGGYALPARQRVAPRDATPVGIHGRAGRTPADSGRFVALGQAHATDAAIAAARLVLASGRVV